MSLIEDICPSFNPRTHQVYTLTRERIKEIKQARKKRGKAQPAPPPKPILAPPSAATAVPVDLQQQPAAAQEEDFWPSEDEIWDAWEAATRSAGPPAAVSATSLAGPAAPGKLPASASPISQTPTVPAASLPDTRMATPAGATAAVSDAGGAAGEVHKGSSVVGTDDPLRELLVLSGNGEGALGLEELVESLEKKGAARRAEADLRKPQVSRVPVTGEGRLGGVVLDRVYKSHPEQYPGPTSWCCMQRAFRKLSERVTGTLD